MQHFTLMTDDNNGVIAIHSGVSDEQARQNTAVGISIALTIIGMLCVVIRVYTRAFIVRNMGIEDWTMITAAVSALIFSIMVLISAREYGVGFHFTSIMPSQIVASAKMGVAEIIFYKGTVTIIKISILMIYLRLAVTKTFELLCRGSIYLLATYQFIVIVVVSAQCTPLRKLWDITGEVQGHCINTTAFYYITSVFHIIMDIWILLLPYKLIIAIPRPTKEKIGVYAVFGLGGLSTICAIVRFHYLVKVTHSQDAFFDSLDINTWSVIEINVGILCASIPTLRPLFSKAQRDRTRTALNISQKYGTQKSGGRSIKSTTMLRGKEISISYPSSLKSSKSSTFSFRTGKGSTFDEEFEMQRDSPPPVPPKDSKTSPRKGPPPMPSRKV